MSQIRADPGEATPQRKRNKIAAPLSEITLQHIFAKKPLWKPVRGKDHSLSSPFLCLSYARV
jgi:hypothetical protein